MKPIVLLFLIAVACLAQVPTRSFTNKAGRVFTFTNAPSLNTNRLDFRLARIGDQHDYSVTNMEFRTKHQPVIAGKDGDEWVVRFKP